ncbi:hypothetical protein QBC36DRAFT_300251 [Triangularia setosa]|uniref:Uncharacterized protein n=1 Tax=Triangularia setosa TaxID=2587417 RepID=A0AAN6W9D6_9PEZI|nr:hypothetical protein QBC36DRAFT_300251 [Podospora setosa]
MKVALPLLILAGTAIAVPVPEEQAQLQAALEAQLLGGLLSGGGGGGEQTMAENADKTPEEKVEVVREPLEALDQDLKVGISCLALPGLSGLNDPPLVGQIAVGILGGGPGGRLGIISGILKLVNDLLTSLLSSDPVGGLIFNSPISGLLQSILSTVGSIVPGYGGILPVNF